MAASASMSRQSQSTTNEQTTAGQSSVAVGAGSQLHDIYNISTDAAVAEAAISSNTAIAGQGLALSAQTVNNMGALSEFALKTTTDFVAQSNSQTQGLLQEFAASLDRSNQQSQAESQSVVDFAGRIAANAAPQTAAAVQENLAGSSPLSSDQTKSQILLATAAFTLIWLLAKNNK